MTTARLDARKLTALGRGGGLVLNLHSVSPHGDRSLSDPLSPETFEELVRWLVRHFRVVTLGDLAHGPAGDERPFAVLSFDDGYRDFLEYAMPILARHRVRANQNVVPGCVESGLPPWNVHLLDMLAELPLDKLRAVRLPGFEATLPNAAHDARVKFGVALSRFLKMRPRSERLPVVTELTTQLGLELENRPTRRMLSMRDLGEVAAQHEVGLHSYAHDSMEFETDDFFRDDLDRCVTWSAEHLPSARAVYAFPNGSCRESQIEIAQTKGIRDVLLVGEKPSRSGSCVHPRVTVYGATSREVRMRIARVC